MAELPCVWSSCGGGSLRGTIQGRRRRMPSSLLCIVSDRRGEWTQCEEGAALFPANVPARALRRPPCVSKREEMMLSFFSAAIPDGWKMVVIRALLRFRGHAIFPLAPTTPARNPDVTTSITGFRPSHIGPPQIGNPLLRTPGGQGRPSWTPVGVSLCVCLSCFSHAVADCSLCCVCWPGSSSQPLRRSLRVCKSQRGSGKVVTPRDLQLNPRGWWVHWSHSGSDVTFRANKTEAANAGRGAVADEPLNLI